MLSESELTTAVIDRRYSRVSTEQDALRIMFGEITQDILNCDIASAYRR
jgi:hypothetical protein